MTINDRPAGGFDVYASPCLVADMPGLQHPGKTSGYWSDAEVWQRNFSTAVWADATPGGRQLDPIEPSAVDGVVIAALVRVNNGRTVATLRAGRRWVGVESDHMDTLGETFLFAGRAHVADCFADLVRFGFGNWEREGLGLPAEIDDAVRWANWIEDSHGASMTRLLDRLDGDRSLWSSALSLSPADSDSRWNRGPPSIQPRWRRLLRRPRGPTTTGPGST